MPVPELTLKRHLGPSSNNGPKHSSSAPTDYSAARAQQAMAVSGVLYAGSGLASEPRLAAFRDGLAKNGYTESQNVVILKSGAEGTLDRLPSRAADLVRRQENGIVAAQSSVAEPVAH